MADWSGTGSQSDPARAQHSPAAKFVENVELIHPHRACALDYSVARVGGFSIEIVAMRVV